MITAVVLLGYTLAVATVGRRILSRLTERTTYPLLGVAAWLSACLSVVASWLLATALAAGAHLPPNAIVSACLAVAEDTATHPHLAIPAVSVPLAAALGLRGVWTAATGYAADVRVRRRHLQALRLLGRADGRLGATVLEAPEPAVYCLDGRRPTIVVTTTALRALSDRQLAAVLDHERCHLTERHHVLVRACRLLARAFPFLPLFTQARTRVAALLEMRADDVAARRHGPGVMAAGLAAVASAAAPGAALGAGGPSTVARAARLLDPPGPGQEPRRWLLTASAAFAAGPLVALMVPFCGA